ncbi:MAG: class I SAM-dependent methyltransferase, partial [Actinomycetota bacterium]
MTPLAEEIAARIKSHGPLTFAAFMQLALYDRSHGYYGSGAVRTGWGGHFVTSPELDPAFGELWANGFEQVWNSCDRPLSFEIVEIGGGEGGFAASVLRSTNGEFGKAIAYRIVERSQEVARRQREAIGNDTRVSWVASIDELDPIEAGCLFANEVLDNLPVHVIEGRGGEIVELFVGLDGDDLVWADGALSSSEVAAYVSRYELNPAPGMRVEIGIAAEQVMKRVAGLTGRGAVIVVDYGDSSSELLARPGGTLVAYSNMGADDDVLSHPGAKDITAHVNWTAIAEALSSAGLTTTGPEKQREILHALGSSDKDAELREQHRAAVLKGDGADALRTLSGRQALGALTDPG